MTEQKPVDGREFEVELALHGPTPADTDHETLHEGLTAAGATRIAPIRVAVPDSERRVAEVVEVATLAVSTAGSLVAMIDTLRNWLAARRAAGARRRDSVGAEDGQVPSVTIRIGEDSLVLTYPSEKAQERAIEDFVRRHDGA